MLSKCDKVLLLSGCCEQRTSLRLSGRESNGESGFPKMGQTNSVFSEEELEDLEVLTVLNRREIQLAFIMFRDLDYEKVSENKRCELPMELIQSIPQLKVNPFRKRICQVFSYSGTGNMTFEDFLEMLSVFNYKSPMTLKLEYAFRIYAKSCRRSAKLVHVYDFCRLCSAPILKKCRNLQ